MNLANYINDLLFRYDCVIVPNFGGFITNKISASLNEETQMFIPPTKQIGFNVNLKHNDGLLANYIASEENISFEKANSIIDAKVFEWLNDLERETIEIASIGKMTLNSDKQLVFEPNEATNFLTDSFGLSTVGASIKEELVEKVIPLNIIDDNEGNTKKGIISFVKVAAAAAILLTIGFGYNQFENSQEKKALATQQENVERKIQEATFVIDNPLPTINLNIAKANSKEFHVIAGAFELLDNANKKISQLKEKGYDASVLGKNKWGLTQVSFQSYETREEARRVLNEVKIAGFEDAWLLVKKFD